MRQFVREATAGAPRRSTGTWSYTAAFGRAAHGDERESSVDTDSLGGGSGSIVRPSEGGCCCWPWRCGGNWLHDVIAIVRCTAAAHWSAETRQSVCRRVLPLETRRVTRLTRCLLDIISQQRLIDWAGQYTFVLPSMRIPIYIFSPHLVSVSHTSDGRL